MKNFSEKTNTHNLINSAAVTKFPPKRGLSSDPQYMVRFLFICF